jgi:hypothetical protein
MSSQVERLVYQEDQHGWVSDYESDVVGPGLREDVGRVM